MGTAATQRPASRSPEADDAGGGPDRKVRSAGSALKPNEPGHHGWMSRMIEPPNSVILVVGRSDFTPPESFGGSTCVATDDCIAIGTINVQDAPTMVTLSPDADTADLVQLGEFSIQSTGEVSVRSVYNEVYEAVPARAGQVRVSLWGNTTDEPCEVVVRVAT